LKARYGLFVLKVPLNANKSIISTVKSRPLAAVVGKPQAQIMCQKPGKTLIPIDKPYFVDVVKCVNEVCSQRWRI